MTLKEIQDLIKFVAKQGVSEVSVEKDDIKLTVKTGQGDEEKNSNASQPVYAQMMPPQMLPQGMPQQSGAPQSQQTDPQPQPAQDPAPKQQEKPPQQGEESGDDESNYVAIKSPMIGTFYRAPSPEKDVFVQVGDKVDKGQTVCVVEAMKLFNEIESEVSGKIVKVVVDNAAPVEYDQPLFLVDPNG